MNKKKSIFPNIIINSGIIKDQVYLAIKDAILDGRLKAGTKISSSRGLAEMMSISRNSVLAGLERLFDEGYIVTKIGAGTYVSTNIPDELIIARKEHLAQNNNLSIPLNINPNLVAMSSLWQRSQSHGTSNKLFNVGVGCIDLFPHDIWGRLLGRAWRQTRKSLGNFNDPKGYQPLRKNICEYVNSVRGVNCSEQQIIITNGSQQAINLVSQLVLTKGDQVWLDNPGYDGACGVFNTLGAKVCSIPSDQNGMNINYGKQAYPNAKLIFTSPSHQFPMGGMLSLSRRFTLLDFAADNNIWILEDDYNSEFRYTSRPIQALQGLDQNQKVLYTGTFSKMMFPEFRLGFLIVPPNLVDVVSHLKYYADSCTSYLEQAALSLFIAEGHYARHVRRVRAACYKRKKVLMDTIHHYLPNKLSIHPSDSGIHIVCWLKERLTETEVITKCRQANLGIQPLSRYCQKPIDKQGIVLGFAAHPEEQLVNGVKVLARLL